MNSKKIGLKRVEKKKKKKAETQTRISAVSAQSKRALNGMRTLKLPRMDLTITLQPES